LARNRQDLVRALSAVTSELLKEKGYICFVDVLMKLDYLSKSDYEHWRFQRVSPLERVLRVNLSRINFIMKTVRRNSLNGHLKPSMTVYKSWGKGKKTLLQFSRLLVDSRVVNVPMASNPLVVPLSSLKPFFFKGLHSGGALLGPWWSRRPRNPIRACLVCLCNVL